MRVEEEERQLLGLAGEQVSYLHRSVGCKLCDSKGFKGRATAKELRATALGKGYRSLADEGLQRVVDGTTSLVEVAREIDLTGRHG